MENHIGSVLAALGDNLPIVLEEGEAPAAIARTELVLALAAQGDASFANGALAAVERLFSTLGLLSDEARANGEWRFMSFPAWLAARSILESMATPNQRLVPQGYWGMQPSERDLEEQRALLRQLEERRTYYHPAHAAPIRYVHVAWGLIQVGSRLLLLHREDRSRKDARGNFVLPGGRFRLADVPMGSRPDDAVEGLAYGGDAWPGQFLDRTLSRELKEELELVRDDDYQASWHSDLPPYRRVEGARNHVAYTEYAIALFTVTLTQQGYLKLLAAQMRRPENMAWFTRDELDAGVSRSGAKAFIDALRPALAAGPDLLAPATASFTPAYRLPNGHKGIDLPLLVGQRLRFGRTGDADIDIDVALDEEEIKWLLALGWHAKGLPFTTPPARPLLADGWVAMEDSDRMLLSRLRERLDAANVPVLEMVDDTYVRLSIPPSSIFFNTALFRCAVQSDALRLHVGAAITALGPVGPLVRIFSVSQSIQAAMCHATGAALLKPSTITPHNLPRMVNQEVGAPARALGVRQIMDGLNHDRRFWRMTVALVGNPSCNEELPSCSST